MCFKGGRILDSRDSRSRVLGILNRFKASAFSLLGCAPYYPFQLVRGKVGTLDMFLNEETPHQPLEIKTNTVNTSVLHAV